MIYQSRRNSIFAIACLIFFILTNLFLLMALKAPESAENNLLLNQFSVKRAMKDLAVIAREPHPAGTLAGIKVRQYIMNRLQSMGVETHIQKTSTIRSWLPNYYPAASVQNIIARLPGKESRGAVLVVGHYDSVPTGPGAGDDGAAVAAMLEVIRVMIGQTDLQNDVIFLFSDAEEGGLLGANAFVSEHPWAADIKIVLNFEARGGSGISTLFETGDNNATWIREFIRVAYYPYGNSLTNIIYSFLPNDTDFTLFKKNGYSGLNFAFIDKIGQYHTALDDPRKLDPRSLQHHGYHMLSLAHHFGNNIIEPVKNFDEVYFNLLPGYIIHYSEDYVLPFAMITVLLFFLVFYSGYRDKILTFRRTIKCSGMFLVLIIFVTVVLTLYWLLIKILHPDYKWMIMGDIYQSVYYRLSCTALVILIISGFYNFIRSRISVPDLFSGALLCWLTMLVIGALFLPEASFLFQWPTVMGIISLYILMYREDHISFRAAFWLIFLSLPAMVLFTPIIHDMYLGLTMRFVSIVALALSLILLILIPSFEVFFIYHRKLVPYISTGAFLLCSLAGSIAGAFDREHPKPNSIVYALDSDRSKAIWTTCDPETDEWSEQFFKKNVRRKLLTNFYPFLKSCIFHNNEMLVADAPVLKLNHPKVTVISDRRTIERNLDLQIDSIRDASVMMIIIKNNPGIRKIQINGKMLKGTFDTDELKPGHKMLLYFADFKEWIIINYQAVPKQGITMGLRLDLNTAVKMIVIDKTFGIPERFTDFIPQPRPASMIPAPGFLLHDSTIVRKSFNF